MRRDPTPYTLHPTPYTLHPEPCTLHPAVGAGGVALRAARLRRFRRTLAALDTNTEAGLASDHDAVPAQSTDELIPTGVTRN